jgi:hypothetical protein
MVPFSSKQDEWGKLEGIDIHNKDRRRKYRRYRLDNPNFHPFTYGHMIEAYIRHPEAKSRGPDGKPCTAETRGLLKRADIVAGKIRYIDKETSSMWEHGDDLSVVTDQDETGFRVIEYGRGRKVVVSEKVRNEIRKIGVKKCARESKIHRSVIRKIVRGVLVKHSTYSKFVQWLQGHKSMVEAMSSS